jgi:hypothetical protein
LQLDDARTEWSIEIPAFDHLGFDRERARWDLLWHHQEEARKCEESAEKAMRLLLGPLEEARHVYLRLAIKLIVHAMRNEDRARELKSLDD